MESLAFLITFLAIGFFVILVLRLLGAWMLRINEVIELQQKAKEHQDLQIKILKHINRRLGSLTPEEIE